MERRVISAENRHGSDLGLSQDNQGDSVRQLIAKIRLENTRLMLEKVKLATGDYPDDLFVYRLKASFQLSKAMLR